jgi:hypothetical protein
MWCRLQICRTCIRFSKGVEGQDGAPRSNFGAYVEKRFKWNRWGVSIHRSSFRYVPLFIKLTHAYGEGHKHLEQLFLAPEPRILRASEDCWYVCRRDRLCGSEHFNDSEEGQLVQSLRGAVKALYDKDLIFTECVDK